MAHRVPYSFSILAELSHNNVYFPNLEVNNQRTIVRHEQLILTVNIAYNMYVFRPLDVHCVDYTCVPSYIQL